ncbi:MAG TPA: ABC transporter permease [Bryobacteraceae bacterium]|nr:ABC transporter permease [Bryobacteraceae bacterium]
MWTEFTADVKQALRMMRKNSTFTAVAVTALALGIGANTGIFSVVDKVLLQPLPYPEPDRMVKLGRQFSNGIGFSNSVPKYMAWRHNDVFSAMTIYDQIGPGVNLSKGDRLQQIKAAHVSADYFKVFGIAPKVGRSFAQSEDAPNGPKVVVLSHQLWAGQFGSDPNILGRTILLNAEPYTVVGIMPASFVPDPPSQVWMPIQADPNSTNQGHYLAVAARMKPGVTLDEARAEMKLRGEDFRRANPKWMDKGESVAVLRMGDAIVRDVKTALLVLTGAVGFVLLIACANVANLLLARAATRQKELAIRSALGAGRGRIVRQLLTESVVLAVMGGVLGFALGAWGVHALLTMIPGDIPRLTSEEHVQSALSIIDWRIGLFAIGLCFVTAILFGLFPAMHVSRTDVSSMLKETSGRSGTGRRQNRVRKMLVGTEIALALVLLLGATLLIRTFAGLSAVKTGIDAHDVLVFQTALAGSRYSTTRAVDNMARQVIRRMEALPGVESVAMAVSVPTQTGIDLPFNIVGKPPKRGEVYNGDVQWRFVTHEYFTALKIPLLRGRLFAETDSGNSQRVVLINQKMAEKYWPKENPIGQVLIIGKGLGKELEDTGPREIVGIVGNVQESGIGDEQDGAMYVPQSQIGDGLTKLAGSVIPASWLVRSHMDASSLRTAAMREIQTVDPQVTFAKVQSMAEILSANVSQQKFNTVLLAIFAAVAMALASIGIYGLMSYSVEQQRQEVGIRMALGADRGRVLSMILRQGMTPVIVGVLVGTGVGFALTRLLSSLLFGVKSNDPTTFVSVAVALTAVALVAALIPAQRATRVDPVMALREE